MSNPAPAITELTEEEIQRKLACEAVKGPRFWRGKELAPLSRGLRDLRDKVVMPDDTAQFFDIALLTILLEAQDATEAGRMQKRRALIMATDDVAGFRARVSMIYDELSDADVAEARKVVNEILGIVTMAETTIAGGKKKAAAAGAPSPTVTRSPSSPSPRKRGGRRTASAGS